MHLICMICMQIPAFSQNELWKTTAEVSLTVGLLSGLRGLRFYKSTWYIAEMGKKLGRAQPPPSPWKPPSCASVHATDINPKGIN